MVGVEVNPVKGLPSGFPVILLKLSLNTLLSRTYKDLFVMIFAIFIGIA